MDPEFLIGYDISDIGVSCSPETFYIFVGNPCGERDACCNGAESILLLGSNQCGLSKSGILCLVAKCSQ